MAMLRDQTLQVEDCSLSLRAVFDETEKVATRHQLDLVDAHQLVPLSRSTVGALEGESRVIFVTADERLARVSQLHSNVITARPLAGKS
jgi:hypothetical protein